MKDRISFNFEDLFANDIYIYIAKSYTLVFKLSTTESLVNMSFTDSFRCWRITNLRKEIDFYIDSIIKRSVLKRMIVHWRFVNLKE